MGLIVCAIILLEVNDDKIFIIVFRCQLLKFIIFGSRVKYNTFGFQYYQANNDLSPVMVGSDEEWYSIDTTRICILLPIEKVKSIIFNNDMDNDFKVRHIQSLLA